MAQFLAGVLLMVILLPFEFLSSLVIAGFLVLMFNLAGIAVLAAVGYWSLVWLTFGALWVVESGVSFALITHKVLEEI